MPKGTHTRTPEMRARMSEAMKRRWAEGRAPVLSAKSRRKQAKSLKATHARRKAAGGWRIAAQLEPAQLI